MPPPSLEKPSLRARLLQEVVSRPDPLSQLRARRFGLDALLRRPPVLELYYEPGDPHSHLAAQLLPRLGERLRTRIAVRIAAPPEMDLYPEADKQRDFALQDAARIAPAYGLTFPQQYVKPAASACFAAARVLLACRNLEAFIEAERGIAEELFAGRQIPGSPGISETQATGRLAASSRRRASLGHYLPGMWQCNGVWYWGVDRMDHLLRDLGKLGLVRGEQPLLERDPSLANLPPRPSPPAPLEFFFSFRSPYSYLAAVALQSQLAALPTALHVRPVLPMAMRGFKIPLRKRLYIVRDVKREADRLGVPFGCIADPLGSGAERCLSAFSVADGVDQQMAFLVSAARAIWAEGVDVATDAGLQWACERAGISWSAVSANLAAGLDLTYAQRNREALDEAGLWGVPSFRCGDLATWGRDRMWLVDAYLGTSL